MLTAERLREVMSYDPATGEFRWRVAPARKPRLCGSPAGSLNNYGYLVIGWEGRLYMAHALAVLYVTGAWPPNRHVFHRDGVHSNNAWLNLGMREKPKALTAERLRELVRYDPETGVFNKAESRHNCGYRTMRVDGHAYLSHRLVFLYMTGAWPLDGVDHKDGDKTNNRWSNLRPADAKLNAENKRKHQPSNRSTGVLGTSFHRAAGKFCAGIKVNGKRRHLGLFDSIDAAYDAYLAAKRQLHSGCTI